MKENHVHQLRTEILGDVTVEILVKESESAEQEYVGVAIVKGTIGEGDTPLVRVHSRCLYGEVFGSLDCDCRAQFDLACECIKNAGAGILIYLEQEGRGCGLISKARAYELQQERSLDTVEAYKTLNLPLDCRQYDVAANYLKKVGIHRVRLLSNNPAKSAGLVEREIEVQMLHLRTQPTEFNREYLFVKQSKLGHDLGLAAPEGTKDGTK